MIISRGLVSWSVSISWLHCSCVFLKSHTNLGKHLQAVQFGSHAHLLFSGGSAKQARDRRFQAILPLRGKILNVEKKDDASLYKNNEISNLILGLGLGLKGEDVDKLRYGKASVTIVSTLSCVLSIACLQSAYAGNVSVSSFACNMLQAN